MGIKKKIKHYLINLTSIGRDEKKKIDKKSTVFKNSYIVNSFKLLLIRLYIQHQTKMFEFSLEKEIALNKQ